MLSRKNSKCDLLDTSGQKQAAGSSSSAASDCRSEAASVCGDNTSVLSSNSNLNKGHQEAKRDSLTGAVISDSQSQSQPQPHHGQPQAAQLAALQISDSELDSGMGSSLLSSTKDW